MSGPDVLIDHVCHKPSSKSLSKLQCQPPVSIQYLLTGVYHAAPAHNVIATTRAIAAVTLSAQSTDVPPFIVTESLLLLDGMAGEALHRVRSQCGHWPQPAGCTAGDAQGQARRPVQGDQEGGTGFPSSPAGGHSAR